MRKIIVLIFVILSFAFYSMAAKPRTSYVYQLDLSGSLVEYATKPKGFPFSVFSFNTKKTTGLNDVLRNIAYAKNNEKISGIFLVNGSLQGGYAAMRDIREALIDFKKSGKFIYAYSDNYTQSNYYLASVADKLMLNTFGTVDFKGLSAQPVFYKNALDKLGVEMQVVKVGSYKSAVEPFTETSMSDFNRNQVTAYLNSMWGVVLTEVGTARKISGDKLNGIATDFAGLKPTDELKALKMVDTLVYANEADTIISKLAPKELKIKRLTHQKLSKKSRKQPRDNNRIAVVYLSGNIGSGKNDINAKSVTSVYQALKNNNSVKAVVLRVNSPGGSAFESEKIHHILSMLKTKKPIVVSMGNYAASGGYYIASMANKIVAQPNTITGSIGIFGLMPNAEKLYQKVGLTFDGVKTNEMADSYSEKRAMNENERQKMQARINSGYELFVKRCSDGRNLTVDSIKALAQGRVWTGTDAKMRGLVDELGGMETAIQAAAKLAGISTYQTITINPKAGKPAQSFANVLEQKIDEQIGESAYGDFLKLLFSISDLNNQDCIQARLMYDIDN
jgi:protease-4